MGANMARRLKDCGYDVSAVYDIRSEAAAELATELGTTAATTLAQVTDLSDVIITVVINDDSMRTIFAGEGDSLLTGAEGRVFINCATISPGGARGDRGRRQGRRRGVARGLHGLQHHPGARRHAVSDARR